MRSRSAIAMLAAAGHLASTADLHAQVTIPPPFVAPTREQGRARPAVEVAPFVGYRFGGDFFELMTAQPVDADGAASWGASVDVPLAPRGLYLEGLFTHQHAKLGVPSFPPGPPKLWRMTVEHWHAGALQELSGGRARPYVDVLAGLTRYSTEGDNEIRFAASGGGGVKLFPSHRFGIRLESRVFATLIDAAGALACSSGVCLVALRTEVVFQWEFSSGFVVRFR